MSWHRVRPTALVLALICFCLPWIEIRCNHPDHGLIVTTQSGLQMTYGGTKTTVNGKPVPEADRSKHSLTAGNREKPVPLIILYLVGMVAALGASLIVADKWRQWAFDTLASGMAAAALLIQLALSFPLVEGIPRGEGGWTYTVWFWLALAFSIAAPLVSVWERLVPMSDPARTGSSQQGESGLAEPGTAPDPGGITSI